MPEERGLVLLMVVGVLAALMVIAIPFAVSMRLAARSTGATVAEERTAEGARGAADHATYTLYTSIRARPTRADGYYTVAGDTDVRMSATLTADLAPSDTVMAVDSTAGFPRTGYLLLGREYIGYTDRNPTQFGTAANPLVRGAFGSTPGTHVAGTRASIYGPDALWDVRVVDEQSKININTLSPEGVARLLNIPAYRHYLDLCYGPSQTELSGDLDPGNTTIGVAAAEGLPARGYVLVDAEYIRYASISYGLLPSDPDTLFNVIRGAFGTVAASHPDGTTVYAYKSPMILVEDLPEGSPTVRVAGITLNADLRNQIPTSGFLNIGDEWMAYNNFSYAAKVGTFSILSRGVRGTTDVDHSEWSAVYIEPFYSVADPLTAPYPMPTTLQADLTAGATQMQVSDTSWFPPTGHLVVEGEVIRYDAKDSSNFLSLTRGQRSTSDVPHLRGARVFPAGALEFFYSAPFANPSGMRHIARRSRLTQALLVSDTAITVESLHPFPAPPPSGVVLVEGERITYEGVETVGIPPIYRLTDLTRANPEWHASGTLVQYVPAAAERADFVLGADVYNLLRDYVTTTSEVGRDGYETLALTQDANSGATAAVLRINPDRQAVAHGSGSTPGFEGAFPIEPYVNLITLKRNTGEQDTRVVTGARSGAGQGEVILSWENSGMAGLRWGLGPSGSGGLSRSYTPSNSHAILVRKPLAQLNINTAADPRSPDRLLIENVVASLTLAAKEDPPVAISPSDAMAVAAQASRQIAVNRVGPTVPPEQVQAEGLNTKGEIDINVLASTAGLTDAKKNLIRRWFGKAFRLSSQDVYSLTSTALTMASSGDTASSRRFMEVRKVVPQSLRVGASPGGFASRHLETQQSFADWSAARAGWPSGSSNLWRLYPFALDSTSLGSATRSAEIPDYAMPDAANEEVDAETTFIANFDWQTEALTDSAAFTPNTGTRGSRSVSPATDSAVLDVFSILSPAGITAATDSSRGVPKVPRYRTAYRGYDTGNRSIAEQSVPPGLSPLTDSLSATVAPFAIEMWFKPSFSGDDANPHTLLDTWPWKGAAEWGAQRDRVSIRYERDPLTMTSKLVLRVADLITATDSGVLPPIGTPRDPFAQFEYPIRDANAFKAGEWYHLAAVVGGSSPGEMMLFLDMNPATSSALPPEKGPYGAFRFAAPGESWLDLTDWPTKRGYAYFLATNHIEWPTLKNDESQGETTITVQGGGDLGLLPATGSISLAGEVGLLRYTARDPATGDITLANPLSIDHSAGETVGIAFKIRNVRGNVGLPNFGQPALNDLASVVKYSESTAGGDWTYAPPYAAAPTGRAWHPFPGGARIDELSPDGNDDWILMEAISTSEILVSERAQLIKGPSGTLPAEIPSDFYLGCSGRWEYTADAVIDNLKISRMDRYGGSSTPITNPARWMSTDPAALTVTLYDATGWPSYGYFVLDGVLYRYNGILPDGKTLDDVRNAQDVSVGPPPAVTIKDGAVTLLTFLDVAKTSQALAPGASEVLLDAEPKGFPQSGYVRVVGGTADELIGYTSIRQDAGVWKLVSDAGLRGAYGTTAGSFLAGEFVRAWPVRFWDRYFGAGAGRTNPHAAYLEASARLDGAFVKGINWEYEEALPAGMQVHLFLRLDGRRDNIPSWAAPTTPNEADDPGTPPVELPDTPGLYEFTATPLPGQYYSINQRADEVELRIYHEYPNGAYPSGPWKAGPKVKSVTIFLEQPNVTFEARRAGF